jgi:phenylalanine-4-hydroxylase
MTETDIDIASDIDGRRELVHLDPDHPGFRDPVYRARRDAIACIAETYVPGTPIPEAPYAEEEHEVWRAVWRALGPAHERYACEEFLACRERLRLPEDRIPQLDEVSERVCTLSGFRLEPVAGLVAPRVFLESLARGVFLSTQYIRHHSAPLYTPEPDVVHELVGHAVLLASPRVAELSRLVGEAVRRTRSEEGLERLARLYWYTIEFGVLRERGGVRAYGAGLLSSAGELGVMHHAELRAFDLDAASREPFDPTTFQPVLFCAGSFDEMFERLAAYLRAW